MNQPLLPDRQQHLEQISGLSVRLRQEKGVNVFEFYRDERSIFTAFTYPKAKAFAHGVRCGREESATTQMRDNRITLISARYENEQETRN